MRTSLLSLLLSGCAFLASEEVMVGCQTADTVTTLVALKHGAVEANPIMATVYSVGGVVGIIAVKALVVYILYNLPRAAPAEVAAHATVNVVTCAAAVNNINVISKIP